MRILEFNGKSQRICEWAIELGINSKIISRRLHDGWSVKDALTRKIRKVSRHLPKRFDNEFTLGGVSKTIKHWAKTYGLSYSCLYNRIYQGWDFKRAVTTPQSFNSKHNVKGMVS